MGPVAPFASVHIREAHDEGGKEAVWGATDHLGIRKRLLCPHYDDSGSVYRCEHFFRKIRIANKNSGKSSGG